MTRTSAQILPPARRYLVIWYDGNDPVTVEWFDSLNDLIIGFPAHLEHMEIFDTQADSIEVKDIQAMREGN